MMTIRFSTGFSIQYNTANYAIRHSVGYTDLYTKKDGDWIAQVPNDALIEIVSPCRTHFAGDGEIKQSLDNAAKSARSLVRKISKAAK